EGAGLFEELEGLLEVAGLVGAEAFDGGLAREVDLLGRLGEGGDCAGRRGHEGGGEGPGAESHHQNLILPTFGAAVLPVFRAGGAVAFVPPGLTGGPFEAPAVWAGGMAGGGSTVMSLDPEAWAGGVGPPSFMPGGLGGVGVGPPLAMPPGLAAGGSDPSCPCS